MGWLLGALESKRRGLSRVTLRELHALKGYYLTVIVTDSVR